MKKFLTGILSVIVVDAYFFDFTLNIFPIANSKMILAVIGAIAFLLNSIRNLQPQLSRRVIISAFLAVLFSLWCYIAITINATYNREFVTYFASFGTWLGGAYGVYALLRLMHQRVDLVLITRLLALVCVTQCALALLIDNFPGFKSLVQSVFLMAYDFMEEIGRLYGIGCALDPSGVRFSVVQVLIAHQLAKETRVRESIGQSSLLLVSFLVITIIGSMISRTTIVGTGLGLAYILLVNLRVQRGGYVSRLQISFTLLILVIVGAAVGISTYLYNTSNVFHEDLRFGFEGFFNWIETGEFRTSSTDILQTMWVWPTTTHGWWLGEGRMGVYETGSDIGYCNYILYCGLIGLFIYSVYYIFNHLSLISKFRNFTIAAILLVATTFIVWSKVTTDIFLIDALLFCIDGDFDQVEDYVPVTTT